ncbi:hypothetical protein JTB14_017705 [Gonioctena quinquepunctata]|nr:hypothetical protein JTB14_017705 [Gonioctena quinquepunctata]
MNSRMVSQAMRRDRFRQIVKYLHCADNIKPDLNDKMWKLRPIMNKFLYGTGTIRDNRVPQSCPLPPKKEFRNKMRGEYESALDKDDGIIMVKWSDNAPVSAVSTCHGVSPVSQKSSGSKSLSPHGIAIWEKCQYRQSDVKSIVLKAIKDEMQKEPVGADKVMRILLEYVLA